MDSDPAYDTDTALSQYLDIVETYDNVNVDTENRSSSIEDLVDDVDDHYLSQAYDSVMNTQLQQIQVHGVNGKCFNTIHFKVSCSCFCNVKTPYYVDD